ncbi:hypothetical protein [Rhizobium sp. N4311]|uniref:hypothetical protein n=1 Tax=Rhizobium sp. N4311 TaxID=1703972 RepID=UPI001FD9F7E4|nr:hypothetical protein [Rhizobium sp. N4311]
MSFSQAAIVADFSRASIAVEFSFGDRLIHCFLRAISSAHILGTEWYPANQAGWKSKLQKASSDDEIGVAAKEMARKKDQAGHPRLPHRDDRLLWSRQPPRHQGGRQHHPGAACGAGRSAPMVCPNRRSEKRRRRYRRDRGILRDNDVKSVAAMDGIFGCPHEEGIDYPLGEACPACSYWNGRNRFTGKLEAD